MITLATSQWNIIQTIQYSQMYTRQRNHIGVELGTGKSEISLGLSKNTDFFMKYRPITDHF